MLRTEPAGGIRARRRGDTGPGLWQQAVVAAGAVALVVTTVALLPVATSGVGVHPAFYPAFAVLAEVCDALTAYLLIHQYLVDRNGRSLGVAAAYLYAALIVIPHVLTFPGVVTDAGLLGGAPSSTAWLWVAWQVGFSLLLALAVLPWPRALTRRVDAALPQGGRRVALVAAVLVALVSALTVVATHGGGLLPALLDGDSYAMVAGAAAAPMLGVSILAVVATAVFVRRADDVGRWMLVAAVAAACDVALTLEGQALYTLGWYAARVMSLVAAGTVLLALLHETARMYRRLRLTHAELRLAHDQLRERSRRDELTGLLNRHAALTDAADLLESAPCCVAMLDADHFKRVNDRHGHLVGDEALRRIGFALSRAVRSADVAGRIGGEEFLVVLAHCDLEEATGAVERARRLLAEDPVRHGRALVEIRLSAGVVAARPGESLTDVMLRADVALYEAKRGGRDRVVAVADVPAGDGSAFEGRAIA